MLSSGLEVRYSKLSGNDLQNYIWSNRCGVSERDFRGKQHLLLRNIDNEEFVVFAAPTPSIPPGHYYMNEKQRLWTRVGVNDKISLAPYNPAYRGDSFYLAAIELVVRSATAVDQTVFPEQQLSDAFRNTCSDQCLQPNQKILVESRGSKFLFTVKSVVLGQLGVAPSDPIASSDPGQRGLLYIGTLITVTAENCESRYAIKVRSEKTGSTTAPILKKQFKFSDLGIGGLDHQSEEIFRRAFLSRMCSPDTIKKLGLTHTRGMLLYGPPGTGKTMIARKIGELLNAHDPIVINGPEVLNKYVGQSEENVRKMFEPAEKEQKAKGDESGLHVIIFDELDAVCKARGSGVGGGTGVGDSIVNQLLTKLDGVEQLNNILLIGMTNRKDLIDEALLRPGRMELHIEIGLPDEAGRLQILGIHTKTLRDNSALDGDVDLGQLAALTTNYSGAELGAVVRNATLLALKRDRDGVRPGQAEKKSSDAVVKMGDFEKTLEKIRPAFGSHEADMRVLVSRGIIMFNPEAFTKAIRSVTDIARAAKVSDSRRPSVVLFHGARRSGTTALASRLALESGYSFIRVISPTNLVRFHGDAAKREHIVQTFFDAQRSSDSLIVIDQFENLIDWNSVGPMYSSTLFNTLRTLIESVVPANKHILIFITTANKPVLTNLGLLGSLSHQVFVPLVKDLEELSRILKERGGTYTGQVNRVCHMIQDLTGTNEVKLGIKHILDVLDLARDIAPGPEAEMENFVRTISEAIIEAGSLY